MIRLTIILLCFFIFRQAGAQDVGNKDEVYVEYIASVKFHVDGLFLSVPIVDIRSSAQLALSFDDLDGDVRDYTYTIVHCDRNWQPSELSELDYIEGFTGERIETFEFSFKTMTQYTNYKLVLPNNDLAWKLSGNYLLHIFDEDGYPVITRRFMVIDPIVRVTPKIVVPSRVNKSRTHHEIDFLVDHERLDIRNPRIEISASVLQNGRWDNAVTDISPVFTKINQLVFDHQDKVIFEAGKEFRFLDLRSFRFRPENISAIERDANGYRIILYKDAERQKKTFFSREDLNGRFIIENSDQNNTKFDLNSDYADILFSLSIPQFVDKEVYIFGGMTDWQLKDQYKMVYNNAVNAYVGIAKLKQGFYDYGYAVKSTLDKDSVADLSEIEGNWYETNNNYTILIYYRPFGGRYDQIIGTSTFSSRR